MEEEESDNVGGESSRTHGHDQLRVRNLCGEKETVSSRLLASRRRVHVPT